MCCFYCHSYAGKKVEGARYDDIFISSEFLVLYGTGSPRDLGLFFLSCPCNGKQNKIRNKLFLFSFLFFFQIVVLS